NIVRFENSRHEVPCSTGKCFAEFKPKRTIWPNAKWIELETHALHECGEALQFICLMYHRKMFVAI
ncbi:MAG TPA: hypothetical protein VMV89_05125, partial [Candidatus Paceibacterota bacterium]|nr:hypothetical protein [Candidatus Paceibacterota bacterium]